MGIPLKIGTKNNDFLSFFITLQPNGKFNDEYFGKKHYIDNREVRELGPQMPP